MAATPSDGTTSLLPSRGTWTKYERMGGPIPPDGLKILRYLYSRGATTPANGITKRECMEDGKCGYKGFREMRVQRLLDWRRTANDTGQRYMYLTPEGLAAVNPESSCTPAATAVFDNLLQFLNRLSDARIYYTIQHSRSDAVMVEVAVPGERWEIDFLADGDVDVEIFKPAGGVTAADGRLDQLLQKFGEPRTEE